MVMTRNDATPEHDMVAPRERWPDENAIAFAAQARWHEHHVHLLADNAMAFPETAPGAGRDSRA